MTRPLPARAPWLVLLGTAPLWSACGGGPAPAPEGAALWFVAQEGLVAARNRTGAPTKPFVTDSFGAGIALRDLDGDGHLDLFVIGGEVPDSLHLGRGDGTFAPSPAALPAADGSWSYGVNATDFDGDGDVDLYITRRGPNRLLRNRGDGTFDEVAQELGLADPSWSTGAVWLDHDRDGDLDLFVVNHIAFDRAAVDDFRISELDCSGGTLGTRYCSPAATNSTAQPGVLDASGSAIAADNDLTLIGSSLPASQFCYFVASQSQASIPNPGGSMGTLCLGAPIARFNAQVQNTGASGSASIAVDLTNVPLPPAFGYAVQPGETWNWQLWYRDVVLSPTSNFTDAISITFQ